MRTPCGLCGDRNCQHHGHPYHHTYAYSHTHPNPHGDPDPHANPHGDADPHGNCNTNRHPNTHLATKSLPDLAKGHFYPVGCLVGWRKLVL